MIKARRRPLLASACLLALLAAGFATAAAAQDLDTSRLPRAGGSKEIYASPLTTIYTAPTPVAPATDAVVRALTADGWQQYVPPNTATANDPNTKLLFFKKGPQALSALVTLAPGQTSTANVNYGAKPVANNVPIPGDATDIAFDPDKPYLSCISGETIAAAMDFFQRELGAAGWSVQAVQPAQGDDPTKMARAFFVRDGHIRLFLSLTADNDGKTKVELQAAPKEEVAASKATEQPLATPSPAPAPNTAADDEVDAMTKQAQQQLDNLTNAQTLLDAKGATPDGMAALNRALTMAKPAARAADGPGEVLAALPGNQASIPLPVTAQEIEFDSTEGSLAFNSPSSVTSVTAFFRAALAPLGWTEQPSVISQPKMVELDFSKEGRAIALTIMQMGNQTMVSGHGDGLAGAAAAPADQASSAAPAPQEIEAEETGGLPIPKDHSMSGTEDTPFRHGVTAYVSIDLTSVLEFYRRELGKRGWQEQGTEAVIKADQAVLNFTSPNGPAVLKLEQKSDGVSISLVVRDTDKAMKAGLLPKPGQAEMMFGNTMTAVATITVNKHTIKVPPGTGAKTPDGPKIELRPGKYKVSLKIAGQPARTEEVEVSAGEAWGVLVGPGGLLPLQIY